MYVIIYGVIRAERSYALDCNCKLLSLLYVFHLSSCLLLCPVAAMFATPTWHHPAIAPSPTTAPKAPIPTFILFNILLSSANISIFLSPKISELMSNQTFFSDTIF